MSKKLLAVFMAVIMVSMAFITANAAGVQIGADDVKAENGKTISIPVKISGNTGIMGYRITVNYPSDVFSNPVVSKGTVCSGGNFNDSISDKTDGKFDVLWSDSKETADNGEIFVISFNVDSDDIKQATISLSYSKADTFDEKWNDVAFECSDINVLLNGYVPDDSEPSPAEMTLAEKIKSWAAGLASPLNTIMGILVAPIALILSLFE